MQAQQSLARRVVTLSFYGSQWPRAVAPYCAKLGVAALGQNARVQADQPLPAFPPSMPEHSRSFTAPIRFSLR
jgi:hypothetical protein